MDVSESTEMYLLKTALLEEAGESVPVPQLADELGISPVSVNQMCRKLQDQGLLTYRPYKGVSLTDAGHEVANKVIRRRRLWEVFLVDELGLSLARAEDAACAFEHVTTDEVVAHLSAYLGHPAECPHHRPIPPGPVPAARRSTRCLSSLRAGECGRVARTADDERGQGLLCDMGIALGADVTVQAVADDGPMLVSAGGHLVSLSKDVSDMIHVEPS